LKPERKRLSLSRYINRRHSDAKIVSRQAELQFERHFLKRFERLSSVKRFVAVWVGLLIVLAIGLIIQNLNLSGYYQTLAGVPGGIYNEGIIGQFTNANPLYATSEVDQSVSRLIFSGLLKYDSSGRLVGDLATGYQTSDNGAVYTVHLRPNLTWQDGQPLTSADVVFTYNLIQNANTGSPLESSWQGISVQLDKWHSSGAYIK
jgi:peptide/nickel transport system substrate-binding protein